jgi:hypothetical protein
VFPASVGGPHWLEDGRAQVLAICASATPS